MRKTPNALAVPAAVLSVAFAGVASADAFDAPEGFYNGVSGTGATLERSLAERMRSGQNQRSYGDFRFAAEFINADPDRRGNILLAYDRRSVDGTWDSGRTWNREHVWPQSRQSGSASNGTRGNLGDHHALRPSNPQLNGNRGNDPFAGRGLTGGPRSVGGGYFPGDADKGDLARTLFYSSTRYGMDLVSGTPTGNRMGDLDALVAWHYLDAPDDFERRRNHAVFSRDLNPRYFQNNRNAYVDLPEAVWSVFVDQENDSRLSIAGASVDADGGSSLARRETVYRGATPVGPGSTLGLDADGVDPTYYRVTAEGVLSLASPTGDGDASTLRAAVGPADLDAGPDPVAYRVAGGLASTTGRKSGSLTVDNLDLTLQGGRGRGANDADDVFFYELTVLDHATASLAAGSVRTDATLDLGVVALGNSFGGSVEVFNLAGDPGFTADLLSDGSASTDNRVAASAFAAVAAGTSQRAGITLDGDRLGAVDARVTLGTREPGFAGQRSTADLGVAVTGRVALGGDATLDGRVDAADAAALRRGRSTNGPSTDWTDGDFNRDGDVDSADLSAFGAGFGSFEAGDQPARAPGAPVTTRDTGPFANPDAGDGSADFLYDVATGDLLVDPDGQSVWSVAVTTLADAAAAGSPAAAWAFADFGDALESTDRSAGAAATGDAFLFASLTAGLGAADFGGVRFFGLESDTARTGRVVLLVPEPGTLWLLLAGGAAGAARRRA